MAARACEEECRCSPLLSAVRLSSQRNPRKRNAAPLNERESFDRENVVAADDTRMNHRVKSELPAAL